MDGGASGGYGVAVGGCAGGDDKEETEFKNGGSHHYGARWL